MPACPPSIGCRPSSAPWRNLRFDKMSNRDRFRSTPMPATFATFPRRLVAAAVVAAAAVALPFAFAQQPAPAPPAAQTAAQSAAQASELAALKKLLEQKFPGADIRYIARSPYFGLYEAALGDQMIY